MPLGLPPGLVEVPAALDDGGSELVPDPLATVLPAMHERAVGPVPAVAVGAGTEPVALPAGETIPGRLESGAPPPRAVPVLAHGDSFPGDTGGGTRPGPARVEGPPGVTGQFVGSLVTLGEAAEGQAGTPVVSVEESTAPESGLRTEARTVLPGGASPGTALTPGAGALAAAGAGGPAQPAPAAMPTLPVNAPFGSGPWSDDVASRIVWIAKHDHTMARLELNPPELGPIHVKLGVQGEHAHVSITAHHALTRDALDGSLDRLRDALFEEGFTQVDVNVGQDRGRGAHPDAGFPEFTSRAGPTEAASEEFLRLRVPLGLLDHYA